MNYRPEVEPSLGVGFTENMDLATLIVGLIIWQHRWPFRVSSSFAEPGLGIENDMGPSFDGAAQVQHMSSGLTQAGCLCCIADAQK